MNNESKNIFDVQGNVVILTGGSGKLGSVYTNYLVDNGAIICNFDINKPSDELLNLSDENYSFFKTDLTKKEDISKSLNQVINCLFLKKLNSLGKNGNTANQQENL